MNTPHGPSNGAPSYARMVRAGLWALPAWAVLLFYGTFTHQPPAADPVRGLGPVCHHT